MVTFLLLGYFLQYMSCFRRDRGFGSMSPTHLHSKLHLKSMYEKNCSESLSSSFIFPSLLHFTGYLYASIVFRTIDDNQLPVLIERVFLISSHLPNMQLHQRQIVKTLWIFVVSSFVWMLATIGLVSYMMVEGDVVMKWFEEGWAPNLGSRLLSHEWFFSSFQVQLVLKILLVVCLVWHDIVQASVISNYCLQAQLLRSYVEFIREKLLQQSIRPLEWIRVSKIKSNQSLVRNLNVLSKMLQRILKSFANCLPTWTRKWLHQFAFSRSSMELTPFPGLYGCWPPTTRYRMILCPFTRGWMLQTSFFGGLLPQPLLYK